jgi:hypothetical protein
MTRRTPAETTRLVRLADPLPCVAWASGGWGYCERPATVAKAELVSLATGRHWRIVPLCPSHMTEPRNPRK